MRFIFGILFLILGILGIIFPIIPGIPFLFVSAFLFGFIDEERLLKVLKKFKTEKKNTVLNKLINYVIIRYLYKKKFTLNKQHRYG